MINNQKTIYDFGANVGQNIEYYLKKCSKLIIVEANIKNIEEIKSKFYKEIENKKILIENCVLVNDESLKEVDFYINKKRDVMSTVIKPKVSEIQEYKVVKLSSFTPAEIINKHGEPYYIKIDLENYDIEILKNLKKNNIYPEFLSFECHDLDSFEYIKKQFNYNSYNIVFGDRIGYEYKWHKIETTNGDEYFKFSTHSAGPFGKDLKYRWLSINNISKIISNSGAGWIDIHCSNGLKKNNNEYLYTLIIIIKNKFYSLFFSFKKLKNRVKGKLKSIL